MVLIPFDGDGGGMCLVYNVFLPMEHLSIPVGCRSQLLIVLRYFSGSQIQTLF